MEHSDWKLQIKADKIVTASAPPENEGKCAFGIVLMTQLNNLKLIRCRECDGFGHYRR